jgi:lipopolysaccharide heptosyltransferase II
MPKLIVRSPNHLGDSVMALSAVGALRDLFRDSEINVIAPDFVAGLFKRHPSVDNVLVLREGAHHGYKSISATRNVLRDAANDFEIGILLTDSLSSASAFRLAGVTNVYGFRGNGRRMTLTAALPELKNTIHRSVRYQNLVRFAARKFWKNPYWVNDVIFERPEIYFSDIERTAARAILERSSVIDSASDEQSFVAISPQAVAESRRWGVENFGALAKRVVRELGMRVVLIGSKADHDAGELVRQHAGEEGVVNLCGSARIRGAGALLECAAAFVGNDSGLAHLSALVDVPLVVLSGADNPIETSPISEQKTIIEKAELNCIHCVRNSCELSGDDHMRCMREISVEDVFSALKSRIAT